MTEVVVELPEDLRAELKEPLGAVYTDPEALLADAREPVVAVGDVVTYHLLEAGYRPHVALVDGHTKREAVDRGVGEVIGLHVDDDPAATSDTGDGSDVGDAGGGDAGGGRRGGSGWFDDVVEVENPAATLTVDLLAALTGALGRPGATVIAVDGEEDLATLPAVLAVPDGASVVYGQPDEGMVLAVADAARKRRVRDLLARMDGDHDALWTALGVTDEG